MKKMMLATLLTFGMTGVAFAKPKVTVSSAKHPNIAAAQKLAQEAYEKITAAQKANEYQLGGNAAKAKDLLEQVNNLLKEAARTANEK